MHIYDSLPVRAAYDQVVQSWDIATTVNGASDWSVCTTWLVQKKVYYLMDVFRARLEFPDLKRKVVDLARAYAAKVILIEDAGIGTGLIQQLRWDGALHPIAVKPQGSKADRIVAQSAILESGRVFVPKSAPWLDAYRTELLAFPAGRNDDQVDSTSQMLNWFEGRRVRAGLF